jgi:hypothetical protein
MSERKTDTIDLGRLGDPFPPEDIEWRVSRAGTGSKGLYCKVLAYVTARAIQERLDAVCGPENWRNEEPRLIEFQVGKYAFACGISIRINGEWITKWDVAEPTPERGEFTGTSAKGGFSGATKRAGTQWDIARYLYYLDETSAEVSDSGGKGWNWAKLPKNEGGRVYYWKTPSLPAWALPKDDHRISEDELASLKSEWRHKFAPECKNPAELREGFSRLVSSVVGEFPSGDATCWTRDAYERCLKRIRESGGPDAVSPDVPFDE